MRKSLLFILALTVSTLGLKAQIMFDPSIEVDFLTDQVILPASPLDYQVLFVGGVDEVQTTATYGNPAGTAPAKQWHDFIGFTPDDSGQSLGWVSVNHEMILADDNIGDGGGMTVFRVQRNADTELLEIMDQTLDDGRSGKFFNVDFVNTVGETGMNCSGITSAADGRIWTAEEWFRSSNSSIADRDTSDFIIGQGTVNGQTVSNGFAQYDGSQVQKYENYNYMVEIDPKQAVAIRKQYNWGRFPFEGGVILPDNRNVFLGGDATPGFLIRFEADTPGDFTSGTLYAHKHDAPSRWVELSVETMDDVLAATDQAIAAGATMYNRLEWVAYDPASGDIFMAETGRDNPGSRWEGENADGAVHAPHHIARAAEQGVSSPNDDEYWDYYGRVLKLDATTWDVSVYLEAGPYFEDSPTISQYPDKHLSNPDGMNVMTINGQSYMLILEDLNGTSNGRVPAGVATRTCEAWMLDMSIENPTEDDLIRISVAPYGAEITGACPTPDGKTLFINSQHPSTANPAPYDNSLTYAITGWDRMVTALEEVKQAEEAGFEIYPNPVARELRFSEVVDAAIYDANGNRLNVYRNVNSIDVSNFTPGAYFLQTADGTTRKVIVQSK